MELSKIASTFKKRFQSTNFLTPVVVRYGQSGRFIYELSTGKFLELSVWGVTLLRSDGTDAPLDVDKPFYSLDEAESYIAGLARFPESAETNL